MPMLTFDTIVAPATPPGEGSISIVRLSGPRATEILGTVFRGRQSVQAMATHHLYYGYLVNRDQQRIDEVLAVIMRAPCSYTREDIVEVHCHGGRQVLRSVLDLFLDAGARMALPGEFTQRAFLNGRLDLAQAEAVIQVISARSEKASRVALDQLDGLLSRKVNLFANHLKEILTLLEAHIDFPDDEVGVLDFAKLIEPVHQVVLEMKTLAGSFDLGRTLRDGISVLILGRPNVGKSSLMNAILGESRAIVTDIAGTTRDTLEEQLVLAGYPVRLIDTAGVRETENPVETEGVRRAREKAATADLVLFVVDGSAPLDEEDFLAFDLCRPESTVLVVNKSDQPQDCDLDCFAALPCRVTVSAKYNQGLTELRAAILKCLSHNDSFGDNEGVIITERRHRDVLLRAVNALEDFLKSAAVEAPYECLAMELRESLDALGQITGETTPDEILEQIFSRFCIGK
jgi:tRNA modification GTPase